MPTKAQIEAGAKALCANWGYEWDRYAGVESGPNRCTCGSFACDCVAPEGQEGIYERPSRVNMHRRAQTGEDITAEVDRALAELETN